jgi:hypothetical protein
MDPVEHMATSAVTRPQAAHALAERHDLVPMHRLMLAMLRDALACLGDGTRASASVLRRREARDAAAWINDCSEDLFSFNCVCETLQINPDALRDSLAGWLSSGRRLTRRSPVAPGGMIGPKRGSRYSARSSARGERG